MNATIQQNEINNAPAGLAPTGANVPHSRSTVLLLYNPFASPLQTETLISFIITSISFVRGHTIGTKPHYSFVLRSVVTFERLIPVNFLLAQLVIKNSKLGQILFGPLYFCATRRQFKSIATEGGIGNWGCKDAPGIGLSWGEFHSSSLQALNTLSLFSLSALLPLV